MSLARAWKAKASLLRRALRGEIGEIHFDWTRENGGDAQAILRSPAGLILGKLLCAFVRECGGPNFVTMEVTVGESPERASIIIQRCGGDTPAATLQKQRAEIAALKARMEQLGVEP